MWREPRPFSFRVLKNSGRIIFAVARLDRFLYSFDMKKVCFLIGLVILFAAGAYFFLTQKLDYSKIVFVLPSSSRASSPYYYKKDGDFFLADDLKQGLEKLGYEVSYRFREDYDNLDLGNVGNVIYFKGYYNFKHLPEAKNDGRKRVLYLYYVEGLEMEILAEADAVVSASEKLIDEVLKPKGIKAFYIPQFTNPERFKPAENEAKVTEVLFVGSNHSRKGRLSVNYAVDAKADLSVYGKFWETFLAPEYLKGNYIDNDELYKYYSGAKVVLNDHREDMRYFGFVSNRIYDVTASGGFVFTDYLPEIEKAYGDSIATYKSEQEFKEKLEYYLSHDSERQNMAKRAREITLKYFTNDAAAQKFDVLLKNIQK